MQRAVLLPYAAWFLLSVARFLCNSLRVAPVSFGVLSARSRIRSRVRSRTFPHVPAYVPAPPTPAVLAFVLFRNFKKKM